MTGSNGTRAPGGEIPPLEFVDPAEVDDTYRVCLWAAPGQGKSVAAASAPGPILVLSADRPSAYKFARKHHAGKTIIETRYQGIESLEGVYRFIRDGDSDIKTLIVDPVTNIIDKLAEVAPPARDGGVDYTWVNKKMAGFVQNLRAFDINVVLVTHEKLNDGKKGDGKLYPALGGPALINKLLGEMDIVARIERHVTGEGDEEDVKWVGQLQPRDNLVCKESTGVLGDRRIADLTRWFQVATDELAPDGTEAPVEGVPHDPSDFTNDPAPAELSKAEAKRIVDRVWEVGIPTSSAQLQLVTMDVDHDGFETKTQAVEVIRKLTTEQAEAFTTWVEECAGKIAAKADA